MAKIGVIIPARNEEAYLGKTLRCLLNQRYKPDKIVVVDDGSTDKTAEIAKKHNALVVQLPDRGYSAIGMTEFAKVLNRGFEALDEMDGFDYAMALDADHLLPKTYIKKIVMRMERDKNLVMASGRFRNEPYYPDMPIDSGRIYKFEFMREIGFFPTDNYGFEDYPLFRAFMMGYKIRCFEDIITSLQRPIKLSRRKLYFLGKGMRALGYDPLYFLGKCVLMFFKAPKGTLSMLKGYASSDSRKYSDLNDFVKEWQRRNIWRRVKEAIQFWK